MITTTIKWWFESDVIQPKRTLRRDENATRKMNFLRRTWWYFLDGSISTRRFLSLPSPAIRFLLPVYWSVWWFCELNAVGCWCDAHIPRRRKFLKTRKTRLIERRWTSRKSHLSLTWIRESKMITAVGWENCSLGCIAWWWNWSIDTRWRLFLLDLFSLRSDC